MNIYWLFILNALLDVFKNSLKLILQSLSFNDCTLFSEYINQRQQIMTVSGEFLFTVLPGDCPPGG